MHTTAGEVLPQWRVNHEDTATKVFHDAPPARRPDGVDGWGVHLMVVLGVLVWVLVVTTLVAHIAAAL